MSSLNQVTAMQKGKIKTCPQCAAQVKDLQLHLFNIHKIKVEGKVLNFADFKQFMFWKENMERETCSRYVKHSGGKKIKNGGTLSYYYCHRDGNYISRGKSERILKTIGSKKINCNCPSLIKVEQNGKDLKVLFVPTHVGHTSDLEAFDKNLNPINKKKMTENLELRKNNLIEHITKVIRSIKTEAGTSALERGFVLVEKSIKEAECQGEMKESPDQTKERRDLHKKIISHNNSVFCLTVRTMKRSNVSKGPQSKKQFRK